MKSIIISDIHNRVNWIDDFLKRTEYDELIFLGDYGDAVAETHEEVTRTANWLKYSLDTYKNTIWCLGNHDMPYMIPWNGHLMCPSWTEYKNKIFNDALTQEDWKKFRLCYFTQGFLLSHAGVTEELFSNPVTGITVESVMKRCEEGLENARGGLPVSILMAGYSRGGQLLGLPGGGITWCGWECLQPIEGLNQIVGHTNRRHVRSKMGKNSENYCLDTRNWDIGVIEDGKFSWFVNPIFVEAGLSR